MQLGTRILVLLYASVAMASPAMSQKENILQMGEQVGCNKAALEQSVATLKSAYPLVHTMWDDGSDDLSNQGAIFKGLKVGESGLLVVCGVELAPVDNIKLGLPDFVFNMLHQYDKYDPGTNSSSQVRLFQVQRAK
jgi:hypothetical protein